MQLCTTYPILLHPKYKLYIPRKDGGRSSIAIQDCIELAVGGLRVYVHGREERLIQAVRGGRVDGSEQQVFCKKQREEIARLGGKSFTWPVFETN